MRNAMRDLLIVGAVCWGAFLFLHGCGQQTVRVVPVPPPVSAIAPATSEAKSEAQNKVHPQRQCGNKAMAPMACVEKIQARRMKVRAERGLPPR